MRPPERILTEDEILDRVDRYADQWIAGRDVRPDSLLESSLEAHGFTLSQIVSRCVQRDQRRGRRP